MNEPDSAAEEVVEINGSRGPIIAFLVGIVLLVVAVALVLFLQQKQTGDKVHDFEQGKLPPALIQKIRGPTGPAGRSGEKGGRGRRGPEGDRGRRGPRGRRGLQGPPGIQGPRGLPGVGIPGRNGSQGPQGQQGEPGVTINPTPPPPSDCPIQIPPVRVCP